MSELVRARITQAVRDLNYAPSFTARSLRAGQSGRVGVACISTQTPWFAEILAGIEERLAATGKSVLLASLMLNGRHDDSAVADWIRLRRVDGLMFVSYTERERSLLSAAERAGLPVVSIAPEARAPVSSVRCDNVHAGRLAAQHLLGYGHRHVGFAGGPTTSIDTRDRSSGVVEVLKHAGAPLRPKDVSYGADYSDASGVRAACAFLRRPPRERPTAMIFGNDAMALGFMRTALQQGLQIPRDVSVVGFDGIPLGALYWPGLTSVAQPTREMGALGCQALLDRMQREAVACELSTTQPGVTLIRRESTGPVS